MFFLNNSMYEKMTKKCFNNKNVLHVNARCPEDSGKSTILKQMVHLYGGGYPEDKRQYFKHIVNGNVLECA